MSSAHQPLSLSQDVLFQEVLDLVSQQQRFPSMENPMPTPNESQTSAPSSEPFVPIPDGSASQPSTLSLAYFSIALKELKDEIGLIRITLTMLSENLTNMNNQVLVLQHALTSPDLKTTTAKRARTGKKSRRPYSLDMSLSDIIRTTVPPLPKRQKRRKKTDRNRF